MMLEEVQLIITNLASKVNALAHPMRNGDKVGLMRIHPTSRECDTVLHLIVNDLGRFISVSAGG